MSDFTVVLHTDLTLSVVQERAIYMNIEEALGNLTDPSGREFAVSVSYGDRLGEAERLLGETHDAWDGEEDSVKEEHAEHIAELASFLGVGATPDVAPGDLVGVGDPLSVLEMSDLPVLRRVRNLLTGEVETLPVGAQFVATTQADVEAGNVPDLALGPEDDQADNEPYPEIDMATLLTLMVDGRTFRPFAQGDWDAFAGASQGSVISYSVPGHDGWAFVVSPAGNEYWLAGGPINVAAYFCSEDGATQSNCYMSERGQWVVF